MPYKIWAKCEHCGHEANGKDDLEEDFGWRNVNGKSIPQAWCRKCRSEHHKKENQE